VLKHSNIIQRYLIDLMLQSNRYFPSNLEVLSWLGAYYVECEVYEQAIRFYEGAVLVQPNNPKWKMMMASCYRKSAHFQKAFDIYRRIYNQYPENVECMSIYE